MGFSNSFLSHLNEICKTCWLVNSMKFARKVSLEMKKIMNKKIFSNFYKWYGPFLISGFLPEAWEIEVYVVS